jgi:hypothetical protein
VLFKILGTKPNPALTCTPLKITNKIQFETNQIKGYFVEVRVVATMIKGCEIEL